MDNFGVKILQVKDSTSVTISKARYFMLQQLGKSYNVAHTPIHTSINSTSWYCFELVYANYLYAGINISNATSNISCTHNDIYLSDNTYEIVDTNFLSLKVVGKSGNVWNIKVSNLSNHGRTIYYNSKMCFKDDAMEWKNLSNISSTYILGNSSAVIKNIRKLVCDIYCGQFFI